MQATKTEAPPKAQRNWRIAITLTGVALAIFMGALESTVVGTAMPTVIATLGGIEIYSWVFAAYILATTVMTPIWGKVADVVGRRPAFFWGLAVFLIGSALSGAARTMPQLIIYRTFQGLGAAALFPVGMTITADLLSLERRAKMVGLFSAMWGVASMFGPIVGGYLTDSPHYGWRWVFYINLPVGLAAIVMVWLTYHETAPEKKRVVFDYGGALTLAALLTTLLLLIERGPQQRAWLSLFEAAACVALLILFIRIERSSQEAVLPLEMFRNRLVGAAMLHGLFAGMALLGTMAFLPLFIQSVLGTSATAAGSILTPFILSWVCCSILSGRLLLRIGYRPLVLAGSAFMLFGAVKLSQISVSTTKFDLVLAVIFLGMGGGLTFVVLMIAVQHAVARARLGVATSAIQFFRTIGAAIGTGVMGSLMTWWLGRRMAAAGNDLPLLRNLGGDLSSIVRHSGQGTLSPRAAEFLRQSLASSLRVAFFFVLVSTVAAVVAGLFVPGGRAHELAHSDHGLP
jgi:EmrB/QacA subfamily drug resistance transporter